MKLENITSPAALQLAVDDVGWMDGRIPYWDNWCPNRTGMVSALSSGCLYGNLPGLGIYRNPSYLYLSR